MDNYFKQDCTQIELIKTIFVDLILVKIICANLLNQFNLCAILPILFSFINSYYFSQAKAII